MTAPTGKMKLRPRCRRLTRGVTITYACHCYNKRYDDFPLFSSHDVGIWTVGKKQYRGSSTSLGVKAPSDKPRLKCCPVLLIQPHIPALDGTRSQITPSVKRYKEQLLVAMTNREERRGNIIPPITDNAEGYHLESQEEQIPFIDSFARLRDG
ncbi:hypothetical protein AVEN_227292-1 [Araneus ventricosus]|uniref:Uncharacterized protein n=1 Tax=Araneus ventricosus TaxID=182803 RepID=A0A4Y2HFT9_ARAVE|nr:hypothetical protein AVEN_227292-1 [Araneus ventricosus]